MHNPKVSIIILIWNGLQDTLECLKSVKKINYPNFEIVVVDNGSTDGSVAEIKKQFPVIAILVNKENLGFAEGNNVGIKYALDHKTDYILLLNNDTIVDSEILKHFIDAADSNMDAGIFGAKIYYYSDPNKIWFAGGERHKNNLYFIHTGQGADDITGEHDKIREIDYACGCAMFFRKETVQKIGLLDKRYFLTYEESDWCYRAKNAGMKSIFVPNAKVWHKVSASFGGSKSSTMAYFLTRNRLLWAKNNLPIMDRWLVYMNSFEFFFPATYGSDRYPIVKKMYWDLLQIFKNPSVTIAKILGIIDFTFRRFGNCPDVIHKLSRK